MKRPQSAKAAAKRLAQLMAHRSPDDEDDDEEEEEEDDLLVDYEPASSSANYGLGLASGRQTKNRIPMSVRKPVEQPLLVPSSPGSRSSPPVNSIQQQRPVSSVRTSPVVNSLEPKPLSTRPGTSVRSPQSRSKFVETSSPHPAFVGHSSQLLDSNEEQSSLHSTSIARPTATINMSEPRTSSGRISSFLQSFSSKLAEPPSFLHSSVSGRSSRWLGSTEEAQPTYASSNALGRSTSNASSSEQPSSARAIGRPNLKVKTNFGGPSSMPIPIKPGLSLTPESQPQRNRDKKLSQEFGSFKYRDHVGGLQSSSALQDELDMLQEENESLLEKLRLAKERCEEAESRTRQLEKQISYLGEGVSLEARLRTRKEAQLQKRETALRSVALVNYGGGVDEIMTLRMEVEVAKEEAKSLRTLTQRMILTRDEMEEVILKRCWVARCWGLCVHHGIHADIAQARNDYWSSYASKAVDVILAVGRKAKDENSISSDLEERESIIENKNEVSERATVEHMLLVERGLRELNSLKVEEAIALSMAKNRGQSMAKVNGTVTIDELKLPSEGYNYSETFELSQEEVEDVYCKQALVMYFWRRAKNLDMESDIADDRLQYWIKQGDKQPNSHDAVDVERALVELRKLGIETKLWEESRRLVDRDNAERTLLETENEMLDQA